jgi:hypothetical protein
LGFIGLCCKREDQVEEASAWLRASLTFVGIHNPNASTGSASTMIQTAHRSRIFPDTFFF